MPDGRRAMTWSALEFDRPLSLDVGHAAVLALSSVAGSPRLVLEATGRNGLVSWKLGCEAWARGRVIDALRAQIPSLQVDQIPSSLDGLRADLAATVRIRMAARTSTSGFDLDASEQVIRGVLGALARTQRAELLHVQLVLGPRQRPRGTVASGQRGRRSAERAAQHQAQCLVRVGASTRDPARSRSLIQAVIGALRPLEAPRVRIDATKASVRAFSAARSPVLWPSRLTTRELTPLTAWPIAPARADHLTGVAPMHPRVLRPPRRQTNGPRRAERRLGIATADPAQPITLSVTDSLRHLHVIGPTGVGKSTLLANLALQDISEGRGTVVIDPKGDLVDDILARADERRRDDIVVIDPSSSAPVGINPLATPRDPELTADILLGLFHSLYADAWGPRTQDVLHASLLTLARRGDASIAMLPLLITNPGFRRSIVGQQSRSDPLGLGSFWAWWDSISDLERQQATAPLMRRLRPLLMRPGLRAVLAQRRPKFAFTDVFTKQRILLVKLGKGTAGPEAAALLGSLVVSQLWTTALARAAVPPEKRKPVMLYVDEVQDYLRLPGDLGDVLAQARGLGLSLTMAHQHFDQLPRALHAAVSANARSRVAFALSAKDAREIAGQTHGRLEPEDFQALPAFHAYAQPLAGNEAGAWLSLTTEPLPAAIRPPSLLQAHAAARYGQPVSEVEADLLSLLDVTPAERDEPLGRTRRPQASNTHEPQKGGAS